MIGSERNLWERRRSDLNRREAMVATITGGLAMLLGATTARSAQARQPATPTGAILPAIVQTWVNAYNARDHAAMAALYTEDGTYEDVPNNYTAQGAEIAPFLATAEQGLADVRIEVTNGFGTSEGAVVEYLFSATNQGLIPIPGTVGQRFTSRAVTVFILDGELIRRSADYYDLMAILSQIGALPPMVSEGAPESMPPATPSTGGG